jgi:hypothetical protein
MTVIPQALQMQNIRRCLYHSLSAARKCGNLKPQNTVAFRGLFCKGLDLSCDNPEKATCISLGRRITILAGLEEQHIKYLLIITERYFGSTRADVRRMLRGNTVLSNLKGPFNRQSDCRKGCLCLWTRTSEISGFRCGISEAFAVRNVTHRMLVGKQLQIYAA